MRLIDADALEELFRETIGHIAKRPEIGKDLEHMVRASAMAVEMIQDAPTVGGWINVKDRLPDYAGYECLVCAVNEIYNQTHVFTAHTGYGEPGWWTSNVHYMSRAKSPCDNSLHPALKITHWMPLPEPPKEEE